MHFGIVIEILSYFASKKKTVMETRAKTLFYFSFFMCAITKKAHLKTKKYYSSSGYTLLFKDVFM